MYNEQLEKLTLDSSKPTKYRWMATLLDIDDSGHVVNFNQAVADHASMFGINIASSLPLAREVLEAVHGLSLASKATSNPVYDGVMGSNYGGGGSACSVSGGGGVQPDPAPIKRGAIEVSMEGGETLIFAEAKAKTPDGFKNLYYFK